jgi:Fe-S-cluster-containing hydrogenase component 2
MVKMLLVDMDKCTGCKQCSLACSLIKEDLFDPNRGRIKILKKEDIALSIPLLCEQCDTFPCISACPEGALTRNETTGIITVNEEICTECGSCVEACTYHGHTVYSIAYLVRSSGWTRQTMRSRRRNYDLREWPCIIN